MFNIFYNDLRVFIQVCLKIDPESYEWGLSARSVDLK